MDQQCVRVARFCFLLAIASVTGALAINAHEAENPDARDQVIEEISFSPATNIITIRARDAQSPSVHFQDELCVQVDKEVAAPLLGKKREDRARRVVKFRSIQEMVEMFRKTWVDQIWASVEPSGLKTVENVVLELPYVMIKLDGEAEPRETSIDMVCFKLDGKAAKPKYAEGKFRYFLIFPNIESLAATVTEK